MTPEQLTSDFEVLADEKHAPDVYRASERIRQHLAEVTAQRDAVLEEAAEKCHSVGLGTKGWTARAPARITKMCEDAIRAMKGGDK